MHERRLGEELFPPRKWGCLTNRKGKKARITFCLFITSCFAWVITRINLGFLSIYVVSSENVISLQNRTENIFCN